MLKKDASAIHTWHTWFQAFHKWLEVFSLWETQHEIHREVDGFLPRKESTPVLPPTTCWETPEQHPAEAAEWRGVMHAHTWVPVECPGQALRAGHLQQAVVRDKGYVTATQNGVFIQGGRSQSKLHRLWLCPDKCHKCQAPQILGSVKGTRPLWMPEGAKGITQQWQRAAGPGVPAKMIKLSWILLDNAIIANCCWGFAGNRVLGQVRQWIFCSQVREEWEPTNGKPWYDKVPLKDAVERLLQRNCNSSGKEQVLFYFLRLICHSSLLEWVCTDLMAILWACTLDLTLQCRLSSPMLWECEENSFSTCMHKILSFQRMRLKLQPF